MIFFVAALLQLQQGMGLYACACCSSGPVAAAASPRPLDPMREPAAGTDTTPSLSCN
jgi:hypothetical protein